MPAEIAIEFSLLGLSGLLLLWVAILSLGVHRLRSQRRAIGALSGNGDLVGALDELHRLYQEIGGDVERLKEAQVALAKGLTGALQGVGVVRFDAFDDAAGRLSFSVALLDANGSGVVISTINGRNESRSYAKPVERGSSSYNLTEEELEAIKLAMKPQSG